ncbi:hypothetical protein DSECCO2_604750 [anaerobic digester metagenome]
MIAGSKRAGLGRAPLEGLGRDLRSVRFLHPAEPLASIEVPLETEPGFDCPAGPVVEHRAEIVPAKAQGRARPDTGRNHMVQLLDQRRLVAKVGLGERGRDQPDAAVDIEPDAARRNNPLGEVEGAHPSDGKAVPPVDVRHRERAAADPRQGRDVCQLTERTLLERPRERLGEEEPPGHTHPWNVADRELPLECSGFYHPFHDIRHRRAPPGKTHHPLPRWTGRCTRSPSPRYHPRPGRGRTVGLRAGRLLPEVKRSPSDRIR